MALYTRQEDYLYGLTFPPQYLDMGQKCVGKCRLQKLIRSQT